MRWGKSEKEWDELELWHKWFSWHPVQITNGPHKGKWVWLEVIFRSLRRSRWYSGMFFASYSIDAPIPNPSTKE